MEDGPDYVWTDADYKRESAPRSLDFMRFNALMDFESQKSRNGVDNMSRREHALLINKMIRDVVVTDTLIKKMEEKNMKHGTCTREEPHRIFKWAYEISKNHGIAAADVVAKALNEVNLIHDDKSTLM
ncbi:hypothetical protein Tco_1070524 [Tanacetum coccineum]|uniref:Uncharacterized protein n=1 Tax=Tanacetum coccineum TaxID=301880 RepID=A0ABQ5HND7_9ASTR